VIASGSGASAHGSPARSRKNRSAEDPLAVTMFNGLRFAVLDVFAIV